MVTRYMDFFCKRKKGQWFFKDEQMYQTEDRTQADVGPTRNLKRQYNRIMVNLPKRKTQL